MTVKAIDSHNAVSSEQIFDIIETYARTIVENPGMVESLPAIMLRGAPGIGKSTIVRSVAKKLGIGFCDVRLAQMERVDFSGLPSVVNGTTQWNVPSFFPQDEKSKGILLLDEITSAPSDVQVAAYSLVLDRRIPNSNYVLPQGWLIVAAGNRTCDKAVVKSMSSALANRFVHFQVESSAEDWTKWAIKNDIHPSVIGYITYRPGNLLKMDGENLEQGWASPRSWERVSSTIKLFKNNNALLEKAIFGLVGTSVGMEFLAFLKMSGEMDNVLDIMLNPKAKVVIPDAPDRKFAMVSAAVYHVWNGKSEEETVNRVLGFYRIVNALPSDFASMALKNALQGNSRVSTSDAIKYMMNSKSYGEMAQKFETAFSKRFATL